LNGDVDQGLDSRKKKREVLLASCTQREGERFATFKRNNKDFQRARREKDSSIDHFFKISERNGKRKGRKRRIMKTLFLSERKREGGKVKENAGESFIVQVGRGRKSSPGELS